MSPERLERLIAAELGEHFDPGQLDAYRVAHDLLEQYFADPRRRGQIVGLLQQTGVSVDVAGRLCRIRAAWTDLPAGGRVIERAVGPVTIRYLLHIPEGYSPESSRPLLVGFPAGPFADDQAERRAADELVARLAGHVPEAVILVPLSGAVRLFDASNRGQIWFAQVLNDVADRVNIDPTRLWYTGHALGAYAAWNTALHQPTYPAAIFSLSGGADQGWQRARIGNLAGVSVRLWHGVDDPVVRVRASEQLAQILRRFNIDHTLIRASDTAHEPPPQAWKEGLQWLSQTRRTPYPARVVVTSNRSEPRFGRVDHLQLFQPADPGRPERLLADQGREIVELLSRPMRADLVIQDNHLTITAVNTALLGVYLNDQLVDFDSPLRVTFQRRELEPIRLEPSFEVLLADQLTTGRGWRYHTAVLELPR